jgi:hypothetical protein
MSALKKLPIDLLRQLSTHLHFQDLVRLWSTCKHFSNISIVEMNPKIDSSMMMYSIATSNLDLLKQVVESGLFETVSAEVMENAVKLLIKNDLSMDFVELICTAMEPIRDWKRLKSLEPKVYGAELVSWVFESKTKKDFETLITLFSKTYDHPILFKAIELNNIDMIKVILENEHEDVNMRVQGYSKPCDSGCAEYPILLAASLNLPKVVQFLLDNGADTENYDADSAICYTEDPETLEVLNNHINAQGKKEYRDFLDQFRQPEGNAYLDWKIVFGHATKAEFEEIVLGCPINDICWEFWSQFQEGDSDKLEIVLKRNDLEEYFYAGDLDSRCTDFGHDFHYGVLYLFISNGFYELSKILLSDPRVDLMVHEAHPFRQDNTLLKACLFRGNRYGVGYDMLELVLSQPKFSIARTKHRLFITLFDVLHDKDSQQNVLKFLFNHPVCNPSGKFQDVQNFTRAHVVEYLMDWYDPEVLWIECVDAFSSLVLELLKNPKIDPSINGNYAILQLTKNPDLDIMEALIRDPRVDPTVDSNRPILNVAESCRIDSCDVLKLFIEKRNVDPRGNHSEVLKIACRGSSRYRMDVVDYLYPLCDVNESFLLPTIQANNEELLEKLLRDIEGDISEPTNFEIMQYLSTEWAAKSILKLVLKDSRFDLSWGSHAFPNRLISYYNDEKCIELMLQHPSVDPFALSDEHLSDLFSRGYKQAAQMVNEYRAKFF